MGGERTERMELTPKQLKDMSDSVGVRAGWDFSRIRDRRAPVPWNYAAVVRRFLSSAHRVLDVGTGGGERFLALAVDFRQGIGIDASPDMIGQALHNKRQQGMANVDLLVMDGGHLAFPPAAFDLVLNRHCTVDVCETARVLRPGGCFITQQVARRNTLNVLQALGWTPESFGEGWWQPVDELATKFARHGCRLVARAEYDVRYWFRDPESLIFWLKSVPLPEPFDPEKNGPGVNRILQDYSTASGIETNEHRELLIVERA
jgi:SAM-dependent methyltransferase